MSAPPTDEASSESLHAADFAAVQYDADLLLYSGPISGPGFADVAAAVLGRAQRKTCLLILTTSGGELHAAYQITRFLHQKYSRLYLCAPAFCKGVGMLVAVGAHRLLIDEYSELGCLRGLVESSTLDAGAVLCREWLPSSAISLLDKMTSQVLRIHGNAVRTDVALLVSGIVTAALMQPITAQVSPTAMAEEHRVGTLAEAYARRLALHARNMRDGAIDRLLEEYASQFIIDLAEARTLFDHIEAPSETLSTALNLLGDQVYAQRQTALVKMLQRARPVPAGGGKNAGVVHPQIAAAAKQKRWEPRTGRAASKPVGQRRRAARRPSAPAGGRRPSPRR